MPCQGVPLRGARRVHYMHRVQYIFGQQMSATDERTGVVGLRRVVWLFRADHDCILHMRTTGIIGVRPRETAGTERSLEEYEGLQGPFEQGHSKEKERTSKDDDEHLVVACAGFTLPIHGAARPRGVGAARTRGRVVGASYDMRPFATERRGTEVASRSCSESGIIWRLVRTEIEPRRRIGSHRVQNVRKVGEVDSRQRPFRRRRELWTRHLFAQLPGVSGASVVVFPGLALYCFSRQGVVAELRLEPHVLEGDVSHRRRPLPVCGVNAEAKAFKGKGLVEAACMRLAADFLEAAAVFGTSSSDVSRGVNVDICWAIPSNLLLRSLEHHHRTSPRPLGGRNHRH
ncbi:uncharacterized protein B0H18DRAFT_70083 [Fomitopsis serialis]|uniref:uncharacterized protein n=1 Tax=Fomitopsis serialis TaxID=139415 RepID=UPI002008EB65|nr:uncharacterized protein B0H18DRAFT_70083 [Neoantrodia serialis]KAH9931912.1 hypothetical protein B0H18DRAFT_70083 [Neoantrodia serialis]